MLSGTFSHKTSAQLFYPAEGITAVTSLSLKFRLRAKVWNFEDTSAQAETGSDTIIIHFSVRDKL